MASMPLLLALLFVTAQGSDAEFARAEVNGQESTSATMEVDLEVTLRGSEGPVVAHLVLPGERERAVPLVRRTDGRWGALLDLRRADWRVVFEDLAGGTVSDGATMTEMGLDPALLGHISGESPALPDDASSGAWAAAFATFAGLTTLFAVWSVFGGIRRSRPPRS